jgi:glycosyltransferase involved in cell wall biosynthesis
LLRRREAASELLSFPLRSKVRRNLRPDAVTLGWIGRRCGCLLVCSQEERARLTDFLSTASVAVIPHFVEERFLSLGREDAKLSLGLAGMHVITLLGYVYPRKGHGLLIEAMRELRSNVHVVVAGGVEPHNADYLENLRDSARASGVLQRLHITGYLSEAELERYLAATDVAACPFTTFSASGSISTWISAGKRILATDLPQVMEYNRLEPGAIETFSPYASAALAAAIQRLLETGANNQLAAIARLRDRLHVSRMLDSHLQVYRKLCFDASGSRERGA